MAKTMDKARNWMNKNSTIVSLAAVILLVVSLGAVAANIFGTGTPPPAADVYYYDLESGELFVAKSSEIPPIHTPSSDGTGRPMGVRAYVYSCSDCSDEESRFIAYMEMYTPDAKQLLENPPAYDSPDDMGAMDDYMLIEEKGHLVRSMENDMWVLQMSDEGIEVMDSFQMRCGENNLPKPCMPDM